MYVINHSKLLTNENQKRCVMIVNITGKNVAFHSNTMHNSEHGTLNPTEILKSLLTKFSNRLHSWIQKKILEIPSSKISWGRKAV